MKKDKKLPSEEIQQLLKQLYEGCQQEDTAVRESQIRRWRQLKLLWEGFNRIWFSETAHDWRIWDESELSPLEQNAYDKPINVFKAYLESIIAALSVTVPAIKCFPDDAENTLDRATARAGDKISKLIYRHNNSPLLWLHSLFIFATEGQTACYSYSKSDEEYGTYTEKIYEDTPEEHEITTCPHCQYEIEDRLVEPGELPVESPVPSIDSLESEFPFGAGIEDEMMGQDICPSCNQMMQPEVNRITSIKTEIVDEITHAKTRVCLEMYGGLYVKIPNYARNQAKCPYLIFSREEDCSLAVEDYEHLNTKEKKEKFKKAFENAGGYTEYAQWGRLSPQYQGEYPRNVVTIHDAWIRPARFNSLPDVDDINKLKKLYPKGVRLTYINDELACAKEEALDKHWTLLDNPLSDYVHFQPAGSALVSIQEITDDLTSLVLQTIEHGIGQTFADPGVLSFKSYSETEVAPGSIFPAVPKSGKSLTDGFHELKTATLSGEVLPFGQNIQSMGQLVSGALPSLFGGALEGSETASQYSMSRAQALQRQQNTWKMFTSWWKIIFGKSIPIFIDEMGDDERDVERTDDGDFINVFIRRAELEGKIGKVELEANENLPITWGQQKDTVEKLLLNGNEKIIEILAAPENISLIHDALGIGDFYVPGEDDVIKQQDELKLLLDSEPILTEDPEMPEMASVEVDQVFDNHAIQFEIVRKWVISEAGRQAKIDNEKGYKNVLLHGMMHKLEIDRMMMEEQAIQSAQGAVPNEKPNSLETKEAPIQESSDVKTTS